MHEMGEHFSYRLRTLLDYKATYYLVGDAIGYLLIDFRGSDANKANGFHWASFAHSTVHLTSILFTAKLKFNFAQPCVSHFVYVGILAFYNVKYYKIFENLFENL